MSILMHPEPSPPDTMVAADVGEFLLQIWDTPGGSTERVEDGYVLLDAEGAQVLLYLDGDE